MDPLSRSFLKIAGQVKPRADQQAHSREAPLFFVLSKTIGTALLPINLLVELGIVSLVLMATRFAALGRRLAATTLVLLALAAFSPLGNLLIYPLESRFPVWDASRGAPDGIIVLGGSVDTDLSAAHRTPVVAHAADRLFAPAELAQRYPNARIVFTGGSANLLSTEAKEADYSAPILEKLGIPKQRLILERDSRNTWENAIFTKKLVSPKPGERWLLVTSAFHMPRSIGIFRKAGFEVEAYPVDWRMGGRDDLFSFTNMAADGLRRTEVAVREWIGLVAYRLMGRTDELLPGPAKD
ncbi:YdcF family protein [Bradyrhizobium sp. LVM 105]|uniref:YdcF family protein n=1 Tax=Bradyrhizobium frederickii TaxID=2560054 RepID=A0A4Y9L7M4_9BRAD|nr:YdcF family protein [Bradyrhizobium sp. LVM 105]TFV38687.1 YdcF family protein [Bradyrhizobium frederickii]